MSNLLTYAQVPRSPKYLKIFRHHRNGAACAVYQDRMVVCAGGNANGGQTCEMLPPHMKLWDDFPQTLAYRSWNPGMAATSWGLVLAGSYYRFQR